MPRVQKVTEKVFAEIAETPQKKGSYTTFFNIDKVLGLPETEKLTELKNMYHDIITESKGTISTLAALEEIIIQIRCKSVINSELRLSLSRNYVYARSIFYRRGNKINDIRVVVGTTVEWGSNLDVLLVHGGFRDHCINILSSHMDKEIEKNDKLLKTLISV